MRCTAFIFARAGPSTHRVDNANQKDWDQQPVFGDPVPEQENNTDDGREEDVDECIDKPLGVDPDFLQHRYSFAAASILEFLKREPESLPQTVIENLHSELLYDERQDIILERLCQPGCQGKGRRH